MGVAVLVYHSRAPRRGHTPTRNRPGMHVEAGRGPARDPSDPEAVLYGVGGGLRAIVDAELLVDRSQVTLYGRLGEKELRRDFLVAQPRSNALQHLDLPIGETRPAAEVEQYRIALGRGQTLAEFPCDDGVDHGAVRVDRPNRSNEILWGDIL